MNQFSSRCRHFQVNWINSHTCQCFGCSKTGHWFEQEGLVMWVRGQAIEVPEKPEEPANSSSQIQSNNVAKKSFPSKAG